MAQIMLWSFAIIGAIVVLGVLTILLSCWWLEIRAQREDRESVARLHACQDYLRSNLVSDAWWFSEDEPTMNVIRRLGEGDRVDAIREDWRNERKAEVHGIDL